jgi:hypothetical protein
MKTIKLLILSLYCLLHFGCNSEFKTEHEKLIEAKVSLKNRINEFNRVKMYCDKEISRISSDTTHGADKELSILYCLEKMDSINSSCKLINQDIDSLNKKLVIHQKKHGC